MWKIQSSSKARLDRYKAPREKKESSHRHHYFHKQSFHRYASWGTTDDFAISSRHFPHVLHCPSAACRTPGLTISWCCPPTSSFVLLLFLPFSLCLFRWLWQYLMNIKYGRTTAVCISLRPPGDFACGLITCWILVWTSSLATRSLNEICSILRYNHRGKNPVINR